MEPKEFFINVETMTPMTEVPEESEGKFAVISKPDQLSEQFSKDQLLKLRTNIRGKAVDGDSKKSLKKLAFECYNEFNKPRKTRAAKATAAPKDKKPSKMDTIRKVLAEKVTVARKELAQIIGSDEPNTHTMISIMNNPKRTKDTLFTTYDKAAGTYTMHKDQAARDAHLKKLADAEAKAKAAEDKKKADEKAAAKAATDKKKADEKAAAKAATDKKKADEKAAAKAATK